MVDTRADHHGERERDPWSGNTGENNDHGRSHRAGAPTDQGGPGQQLC